MRLTESIVAMDNDCPCRSQRFSRSTNHYLTADLYSSLLSKVNEQASSTVQILLIHY
jgi:hypothetical protein